MKRVPSTTVTLRLLAPLQCSMKFGLSGITHQRINHCYFKPRFPGVLPPHGGRNVLIDRFVCYNLGRQVPPHVLGAQETWGASRRLKQADILAERFEIIAFQFPSLSFCADEE